MATRLKTNVADAPRRERPGIGGAAGGQWWRVWILATSLGATVVGWVALERDPATGPAIAASTAHSSTRVGPASVGAADGSRQLQPAAGSPQAMPQKPVFHAPVTRTRRS